MLDVIALDDQPNLIPFANGVELLVRRRDQIVKSACGAVPVFPCFRVRMTFVVEYLHLEPQTRITALHHVLIDQILDAAVCTGADAPFELQFKIIVLTDGNQVAALLALLALPGQVFDRTFLDRPTFARYLIATEPAPAVPGLAVKQQLPARSFFSRRERVGC